MCGIGGAITPDGGRGEAVAQYVNLRQRHRGPDHAVVVSVGPFTLANTRLAIQDPTAAGNQPFWSPDGRYVCVFNGEIYNFVELIKRYRLKLPNHCDGAVIPELWRQLGPASFRELRGMFAIALVDTKKRTLTLARDPFGIKPLYYRRLKDGTIAFASEVRPLASLDSRPLLDQGALSRFLRLGAIGADQCPFAGVEAIPPNAVVSFQGDGSNTVAPLLPGPRPLLSSDAGQDLGTVFNESVKVHLRSDVPMVLLLSSGVDSGAIASTAHSLGRDLHCMTVGGFGGGADEIQDAAVVAQHYGHNHQVVLAQLDQGSTADFFASMQRPSIDGLNTFLVCRAVQAAGYRVALSGLGGDEALGGYAQYRILPLLSALDVVDRIPGLNRALSTAIVAARVGANPDKIGRLLRRNGPRSALGLDLLQREVLPMDQVAALTGTTPESEALNAMSPDTGQRDFAALVESELKHYMQATLLPDADAFSMCSSVELRVPFVDREVFASAALLNAALRHSPGKRALAEALEDRFLLELVKKRKRGFSVPMAHWLRDGPLQPLLDDVRNPEAPVWDHLDRAVAKPILFAPVGERWSSQWSFAALNAWLRSVKDDIGV